ncbi:40S ribosomal protein S3A, putative, partial [Trypanosoma cruzi]
MLFHIILFSSPFVVVFSHKKKNPFFCGDACARTHRRKEIMTLGKNKRI